METSMLQRSARVLGLGLVLLLMAWGARVTFLEGFYLKWPDFTGDFTAVMFSHKYWEGHRGIAYGPLFVLESWYVTRWPDVFTPVFFALANIPLVVAAFVFSVRACRANWTVVLISLAAWLCYWRMFYAFAVAANPEFLELFFLCAAWFAASRRSDVFEGLGIAAAGLTKLIPWMFVFPLMLRRSVRALGVAAVLAIATFVVVGIGQQMSASEVLFQAIIPYSGRPAPPLIPSSHSTQWVGVLEALARMIYPAGPHPLRGTPLHVVQGLFLAIVAVILAGTVWATIRLLRRRREIGETTCLALIYALYFALVPVFTLAAHPHTFVFLLPVWTVFIDQISKDEGHHRRRAIFAAAVGFCYAQSGFPVVFALMDLVVRPWIWLRNSWVVGEPMVGNVLLLPVLWAYVAVTTRGAISAASAAAPAGGPALPPPSHPAPHRG
jgi:hypothetical protein